MQARIQQARQLRGEIAVPGDKSISHRALILGAVAEGRTVVHGLSPAADCASTIRSLQALGLEIALPEKNTAVVNGKGLLGLAEPADVLDAGNSGTTTRLLAGLLAGQPFFTVVTGDDSLRSRPMDRIVKPLAQMGATILGRREGRFLPLAIRGGNLKPIRYSLPVASAQVKSCILLAGMYAEGDTVVEELEPTRDHTERMLKAMDVPLKQKGKHITVRGGWAPQAANIVVPGDASSAAFFLVAAATVPNSAVTVTNVGINPTRIGFISTLKEMGAELQMENERLENGEPVADITCRTSSLRGITLEGDIIPSLVDELPIIAVAATQANGAMIVRNAAELRVKESDRIDAIVTELSRLGAKIEATPDGFVVEGPTPLRGAGCQSYRDHRIAMSLAVAGLVAKGDTVVDDAECVDISFPGFFDLLESVRRGV
ncbi:MAG: 3-phosphoshikimate 1-carboxyvinyltransferase [Dehalococcoidales bacterium]|nr:3-phosphoshikimate 1-carboxyvinyltransferase [Dehalococcoidales bacterium]